jgi:hypothetical protein
MNLAKLFIIKIHKETYSAAYFQKILFHHCHKKSTYSLSFRLNRYYFIGGLKKTNIFFADSKGEKKLHGK